LFIIFLIKKKLKKDWQESKGEVFDIKGSVIFVLTIMAIIYGFTTLKDGFFVLFFILMSILGILIFIKWEMRFKSPILDLSFFRNNVFALSCLAMLIINFATSGMWPLLSLYLQYLKSLNAQYAGITLVTQPLVVSLLSPFVGRLSDKVESFILAPLGISLTSTGLFLFTFLNATFSWPFIILVLVLMEPEWLFSLLPPQMLLWLLLGKKSMERHQQSFLP